MPEKTFAPHPEPTPDTTSGVGRRGLLAAGALVASPPPPHTPVPLMRAVPAAGTPRARPCRSPLARPAA